MPFVALKAPMTGTIPHGEGPRAEGTCRPHREYPYPRCGQRGVNSLGAAPFIHSYSQGNTQDLGDNKQMLPIC